MSNDLVLLKGNEPLTTSLIVAEKTELEHRSIFRMIKKYENDLKEFGVLRFQIAKPKTGRPLDFVYLNEPQTSLLIMYLKNTEKVRNFKKLITKEFFRMKKMLLSLATQKANQEYLEARGKGKVSRLKETDTIKQFIQYATNQGSKNANKYYITLTNMENKALFLIEQKFKNIRELLNINQLDEVKQADEIVLKALNDGMIDNMRYKDIYQLAKKRVELFASLKGKSIVPSIDFKMIGD